MLELVKELNKLGIEAMLLNNVIIVTINDFLGFDEDWNEIEKDEFLVEKEVAFVKTLLQGLPYQLEYSSDEI